MILLLTFWTKASGAGCNRGVRLLPVTSDTEGRERDREGEGEGGGGGDGRTMPSVNWQACNYETWELPL